LLLLLKNCQVLLFDAFSQSWSEPRSRQQSSVLHSLREKTIQDVPVYDFSF